jgi:putative membrane protein
MTQRYVQIVALRRVSGPKAVAIALVVSVAALVLLVAVVYGHGRPGNLPTWVTRLPALNAALNATSAVFLVLAYRLRRRDSAAHARRMLGALCASALFLASYIVYHSFHGDTPFPGHGIVRPIYFSVLVSHIALSALALPLVFTTFFFALSGRIRQHRTIARFTFPVWLYVSVTGVLVFLMMRTYS